MYNQEICDKRIWELQKSVPFKLRRFPKEESVDIQEQLAVIWDKEKKKPFRPLKEWEEQFIINEIYLSQLDFNYWAPRYAYLNTKSGETKRIDFWESQLIALDHIAKGEKDAWLNQTDNLWLWLKARQLGATQVSETSIAHRLCFYDNQRAVIASDDPQNSTRLSRRVDFIIRKLPWWMRPTVGEKVKGVEMFLTERNSYLLIGHGNMDPDTGGIGQGETCNIFHLTEIPDWKNWQQIDEDFLPTVPIHPTSVGFGESTARGRHDHWHDMFALAWEGRSRWRALFIPWYAEQHTYRMRAPEAWRPGELAEAHARKVLRQSPNYCMGRTVELSRDQLYWWERTYDEYKAKGRLHIFYQEYASDHIEAFQSAATSLFSNDLIDQLAAHASPYMVYEVVSG